MSSRINSGNNLELGNWIFFISSYLVLEINEPAPKANVNILSATCDQVLLLVLT